MEELELQVLEDSNEENDVKYPLPATFRSNLAMLNYENLESRIKKYGDYIWTVDDCFIDFDNFLEFIKKLPYTYDKDLNNAAYLYRSDISFAKPYRDHFQEWVQTVLEREILLNPNDHTRFHMQSSFFSKAWYDMHYINLPPHRDDYNEPVLDITKKPTQDRVVPYVILFYMNDGLGTSIYKAKNAAIENMNVYDSLYAFDFVPAEFGDNYELFYEEIFSSLGKQNSAILYPRNAPHRVTKYKNGKSQVGVFEAEGRFYLMYAFDVPSLI